MRAVLDHVGIAVKDLAAALAFYRDALGLEVETPEDVASQQVRAHFLPVGGPKLELLEATASESAIGRYLEKRGPGLHHITLRVDDIHAALSQLKARGARLVDEQPRAGAEGALVAFVHPSSAHGVLVELKQAPAADQETSVASGQPPAPAIRRFAVGDLELVSLYDGFFRVDGGSMFGIVPRPLWTKKATPDAGNRVTLALRPLLVRGARTMLIDAGIGDKQDARFEDRYAVDRKRHLDHALAEAGVSADAIDIVLATHLHFDHAGGFTTRDASGRLRPRFPRAQYVIRRGEWDDGMQLHARNRAGYLADNYAPLAEAGVLQLVDADQTIMPGVKVRWTGGHTAHHQIVMLESGKQSAAFVADLMPTAAHASTLWTSSFDLYPVETIAAKEQLARDAVDTQLLVLFEHDPVVAAGYLREHNRKRVVEPA